jgi:predicted AlkP superfamily pyrophosphatase or phosphodiesterase
MKHYGLTTTHKTLPELDARLAKNYKNVVLVLLDGLGSHILNLHLSKNSFLQSHKVKDISSVFPPTTTAATTTICTGLSPKEHGWLAWNCYFKETNECISLFQGLNDYTKLDSLNGISGFSALPYEKIVKKMKKQPELGVTGNEVFPAFRPRGAENFDDFCEQIKNICHVKGRQYIYAYWDQPDGKMHEKGVTAPEVKKLIKEFDAKLERTIKQLAGDTLFIIIADHGLLDPSELIFINDMPELMECLSIPPSMETRVISFTIKENMKDVFAERFNVRFENDFILVRHEQYINEFLGAGIEHKRIQDFVGDFVAMAITDKCLLYRHPTVPDKVEILKAYHAGLTSIEMTVPLIIAG